eukprot:12626607-Alexandrium_andersonii.AAC.1
MERRGARPRSRSKRGRDPSPGRQAARAGPRRCSNALQSQISCPMSSGRSPQKGHKAESASPA